MVNIVGWCSDSCILCMLSVGLFLLCSVMLVVLVLFVFRLSVWIVIGRLFMFIIRL